MDLIRTWVDVINWRMRTRPGAAPEADIDRGATMVMAMVR